MKTKSVAKTVARSGMFIALLLILQFVTKNAGQLVTGSAVNCLLALAALTSGFEVALAVSLVSPFFAFLLGIGPKLFPIVPIIAVTNAVYALIIHFVHKSGKLGKVGYPVSVIVGAVVKAGLLYLAVVKGVCVLMTLPEKQVQTFTAMFSVPQLITALIGGALAGVIYLAVKKGITDKKAE